MTEQKIKLAGFPNGPEYAARELEDQVIEWILDAKANGGVLGLSGGIDSTTVAYICQNAFKRYNKENQTGPKLNLLGLILPSKVNSPKDAEDGLRVADALGIERKVIPIQPVADAFIAQNPEAVNSDYHKGNLYSELRAVTLSRHGAAKNLLLMGTGNRDEDYVLGYFTKRGDGAVDNNILGMLPKRLVRDIAAWYGVSPDLVNRVPTAGLWPGQTDEGEIGYTYAQAEIIKNGLDQGFDKEQVEKITGYDRKIIEDVIRRNATTEHKRNTPKIGKVTLAYE